jgi:hypothetical protein
MITKKFVTKRSLILLVSLFIYTAALSQQNVFGFKGNNGVLQFIELQYFAGGQKTDNPDRIINISIANTYEMHQMKYPKLTQYIYNDVRFAADKLFVSSAGSEERIINVNVTQKMKGEEWGKALLSCEFTEPIDVEFNYTNQYLTMQYFIAENDNENYIFKLENVMMSGNLDDVEKYKNNASKGIYLVTITYLIK